jgi:2-dehydro-3-deoxyglucarate aldolase
MNSLTKLRKKKINSIRKKLKSKIPSFGTWQQIQSIEISKILSNGNYDWIALDLEHGAFDNSFLNFAFDKITTNGCLPLARVSKPDKYLARSVLDYGAGGIIIPMIETKEQIEEIINEAIWPPYGKRGVSFCNANEFGDSFNDYSKEAKSPLIIAMIENQTGVENLEHILSVKNLDAILIGPYDLSASLGIVGKFLHKDFIKCQNEIFKICKKFRVPFGFHIVEPEKKIITNKLNQGATFIALGMDTTFLNKFSKLNRYYERKRNKT